jgi:hypothetical protein
MRGGRAPCVESNPTDSDRAPPRRRCVAASSLLTCLVWVVVAGCGRTDLGAIGFAAADASAIDTGQGPDAHPADAEPDHQARDGSADADGARDGNADGADARSREDSPPLCSAASCPGCCGTTGCMPGVSPTACGFGAQACTDCKALGLDCVPALAGEQGGACGALDAGTSSDGGSLCGPSTCTGCCAGTTCVAGTSAMACGSHGQACVACEGTLEACVAQGAGGVCAGSGPKCGPADCAGCCDSSGVCEDPAMIYACGTNGVACAFCLPGEACESGTCEMATSCGPLSCSGCCQDGMCLTGVDDEACGAAGAACAPCDVGNNEGCQVIDAKSGGYCATTAKGCGIGNCGTGCCDVYDNCQPGDTDLYCGGVVTNGRAIFCGTCSGSCASGTCDTKRCGPENCGSGCCSADGSCWKGGLDGEHCGYGGLLCVDCGPGYDCIVAPSPTGDVCSVACDPNNCQGCCGAGVCSTGLTVSACGAGGDACVQCVDGQSCVDGECVL